MFYTGKATATPQLPPTTGLTPNPSPRGEGSDMYCGGKTNEAEMSVYRRYTHSNSKAYYSPLPLERGWG